MSHQGFTKSGPGDFERPQEPVGPVPYRIDPVVLHTGPDDRLTGILTTPEGEEARPAVLLIPGSGKNDRDETVCGHRPFLVWSDALSRAGFVVLRLDDRGVGGSTGDKDGLTHDALLEDVRMALGWLARHGGNVSADELFAIGHSEGALIAAAAHESLAGVVLLGGPGVPGDVLAVAQAEGLSRAAGMDDAVVAYEAAMNTEVFAAVKRHEDHATRRSVVTAILRRHLEHWPGLSHTAGELDAAAAAMAERVCAPVFRAFLASTPATVLARVTCPVLALFGERDLQTDPALNAEAAREALVASPSPSVTVQVVPGVNHLFQRCATGAIEEYEQIAETIAPAVLERVIAWLTAVRAAKR